MNYIIPETQECPTMELMNSCIEPKFNVGDWIVTKLRSVWHIDNVDNKLYRVSSRITKYEYLPISRQNEVRLWTLADAEEGDILVFNDNPFIFKGLIDPAHPGYPVAYCDISTWGFKVSSGYWWSDKDVKPATGKQCDLLFQKMKEAGYKWNAEKKKLVKLE